MVGVDLHRLIVEGQAELISLAAEDGTLVYVNPAYGRFFGAEPAAMVGRNLLELVAEHDRPDVTEHLRHTAAGGLLVPAANRMVCAQGMERWVAWTNSCIAADGDRPLLIQSVGRDITVQRQAEHALARNETHSRLLYEATPAMLHSIDLQGRLVNVTDSWLKRLGYDRPDVIGHRSVEFLTPASARYATEVVLPAFFHTGRCEDIEYQMVCKDGSVIDVLLSAVLERDDDGQPIRSLASVRDVTQRNVATASLTETTKLLQLVLDGMPARISYWSADSLNRFANQAFLDHYGVEQASITGRHARDVLGLEAYSRIEALISAALAGQDRHFEAVQGPPGKQRTTDMRFISDRRDGQVHGLFVFALDITAQRQAERDLADQERSFKLLVDGIRDYAIYMLDPIGNVATWNSGAQRNKGYRPEQVIGQPHSMFFTPEDVRAGKPQLALAEAARSGRFEGEGWRLGGDGTRYWASILVSAIRDETGELVGFAKLTRDLTEKRRQEDLLTRVVELAPCAMLMADPAGLVVMVNAEAESTFGHPRADMLGQPLDMLIPQLRRPDVESRNGFAAHASARALGVGRELRARRRSGEEFPVEIGLASIDTAQGTATLAAVFDIAERRRQHAATEQALAEKETLLKELYHRVKNNLQVVQSLLNLQRRALPEGVARDALHDSVQRVRAMALVHEKLYQSDNLAAISLVTYTTDLVAQIAEAHGMDRGHIAIDVAIDDIETGLDSAVPYGLLLTELVTNAIKHAFPGKARGTVSVSLVRLEGGDLLTVSDNGVGATAPEARPQPSTSMGLTLAATLSSQLGGELRTRCDQGWTSSVLLARL